VIRVDTYCAESTIEKLLEEISDSKLVLISSEKLFYTDLISIKILEYILKKNPHLKAIIYLTDGELDYLLMQLSDVEGSRVQLVRYVDLSTLFTHISRAYLVPELYSNTVVLVPLTRIYITTSGSLKSILKIRPIVVELVVLLKGILGRVESKSLVTVHRGYVKILKRYVDVHISVTSETEFEVTRVVN